MDIRLIKNYIKKKDIILVHRNSGLVTIDLIEMDGGSLGGKEVILKIDESLKNQYENFYIARNIKRYLELQIGIGTKEVGSGFGF